MARFVDLYFAFSRRQSLPELFGALREGGWRMDDRGEIRYLVDPDMFEWSTAALGKESRAIEELERARLSVGSCAVILTWRDTGIGGSFMVDSFGDGLTLDPVRNVVRRQDVDIFVDFEWYLARVISLLRPLGVSGCRMSDMPS